ncbi:MAG: hypothetical protein PHV28_08670 [Kiritimatiellae bacterium]|nr:hypothetical protein [Kiritimatiellia bacterium]
MDAIVNAGSALTGGKAAHRRLLADLPYPEKVRIVVELQKIAVPILKARGVAASPWRLDELSRTTNAQVRRPQLPNPPRSNLRVER